MRIYLVTAPDFQLANFQSFLKQHDASPLSFTDDGGTICEAAGRLCYMSYGKGRKTNREYLEHILSVGHGSVLEHANWGVIIEGVSRSFTHELVRHRAGFAYSQLSQRYVDESKADFIEPDCIAETPEAHEVFQKAIKAAHEAYVELVKILAEKFKDEPDKTLRRKKARQAARSVLPNATETKIFVTANARAWRHFFEMRANEHADVEIRKVAVAIWEILSKEAPAIFGDYRKIKLSDGTIALKTEWRKV
ncbi:MAG: FAD-dependent thymidylate synthase [Thermoplasmata archaeon]|nr:MAG: FAD-dependent thymidylate synthase [Thermoplasmata archaeon]